jgi:putative endonuclease
VRLRQAPARALKSSLERAPGGAAEELVARRLIADGWTILERRLRVGRLEIDILASRDDVAVIVEVRGRRAGTRVDPLDSVAGAKAARLATAARRLWSSRFAADGAIRVLRIDLAAVTWNATGEPTIEIVEGAIET